MKTASKKPHGDTDSQGDQASNYTLSTLPVMSLSTQDFLNELQKFKDWISSEGSRPFQSFSIANACHIF